MAAGPRSQSRPDRESWRREHDPSVSVRVEIADSGPGKGGIGEVCKPTAVGSHSPEAKTARDGRAAPPQRSRPETPLSPRGPGPGWELERDLPGACWEEMVPHSQQTIIKTSTLHISNQGFAGVWFYFEGESPTQVISTCKA